MNKLRKIFSIVFVLTFVALFVSSIYAVGTGYINGDDFGNPDKATTADDVVNVANNVWTTAASIIQILAVAAIVFAGLRYMFASADAKADIKKQTVILIVGAILVFGATYVIKLVNSATGSVLS